MKRPKPARIAPNRLSKSTGLRPTLSEIRAAAKMTKTSNTEPIMGAFNASPRENLIYPVASKSRDVENRYRNVFSEAFTRKTRSIGALWASNASRRGACDSCLRRSAIARNSGDYSTHGRAKKPMTTKMTDRRNGIRQPHATNSASPIRDITRPIAPAASTCRDSARSQRQCSTNLAGSSMQWRLSDPAQPSI